MSTTFDRTFVSQVIQVGDLIFDGTSPNELSFEERLVYESAKPLYDMMVSNNQHHVDIVHTVLTKLSDIAFNVYEYESYREYLNNACREFRILIMDVRYQLACIINDNNNTEWIEIDIPISAITVVQNRNATAAANINMCRPITKTVALKKKDQETLTDDDCSICCDRHTLIKSTRTSCGHYFGSDCLSKWIDIKANQGTVPECPICKTDILNITKYHSSNTTI
jgi:hypothetical protein